MKVKPINAKLIPYPQGSGGSVKSFKLKENKFFTISHGVFGGVKCTTISLNGMFFKEICFENYVEFTSSKQIWKAISTDINLLEQVINTFIDDRFDKGYYQGVSDAKYNMRMALGL